MSDLDKLIGRFPRAGLMQNPTPLERLNNISDQTGLDLWIKRDDLTSLGMGGNKMRQLDYYMGAAQACSADTILITGAVQSNYVRAAAACAAKLGLRAILQLENRVPGMDDLYASSGNVLLAQILGAEHMRYPEGEDEAGADRALRDRAEALRREGRTPYVIPLGLDNPPLGALGYMRAAEEISAQSASFDAVVVASGSGVTHAGILAGFRALGSDVPVYGICVRRDAVAQAARIAAVAGHLAGMLGTQEVFGASDIRVRDGALAPGYGRMSDRVRAALLLMARSEGILLDPVYTSKVFAAVLDLARDGTFDAGARVLFVHTGGQPALFGYGKGVLG